jgi:hypothetical protein
VVSEQSTDPKRLCDETQWVKSQIWYIATAAVTLIAAIFAVSRAIGVEKLTAPEKSVATVFLALIAVFGCIFLGKLQYYLADVRKRIANSEQKTDDDRYVRGLDILIALMVAVATSAGVVIYTLWR